MWEIGKELFLQLQAMSGMLSASADFRFSGGIYYYHNDIHIYIEYHMDFLPKTANLQGGTHTIHAIHAINTIPSNPSQSKYPYG